MMKNRQLIKITPIILFLFFLLIMNNMSAQQVIEGLHYTDGKPVRVTIRDGKIESVEHIQKLSDANNDLIVAPGFFDNQVNGFAGVSFVFGKSDLTQDGILKATRELWKKGVTTYMPTLTTNSQEILVRNFAILAKAIDDNRLMGSIPGFHLEGPYINPGRWISRGTPQTVRSVA